MNITNINKQLEKGELPIEFYDLIFPEPEKDIIDWEKVKYNSFYKSYDYYESRFNLDYSHIKGFEKVIESIVEKNKNKTPLDEINERIEEAKNQENNNEELKLLDEIENILTVK